MIVFTPDAANAAMLSALSAPAAVNPGARFIKGGSDGMRRLPRTIKAKRSAELQPVAVPSNPQGKSPGQIPGQIVARLGGVLARPLHQVAGADPEALEPATWCSGRAN